MVSSGSEDEERQRQQAVRLQFGEHAEEWARKVMAALRAAYPSLRDYWEEIAQEAHERTLRVWLEGRGEPDRSPLPYMKKVARNIAVDALRSPERPLEDEALLPLVEERGLHQRDLLTPPDPAVCLASEAIANMKPSKRKNVAEAQIQGDDENTIAVDLQTPPAQVRSLSSKASRDLRGAEELQAFIRWGHHRKHRRGEEDA
ncbi:hypothetical protein PV721_38610 [Streptomyces sp. MB09-01]|uniref:hypothetical protein n=1 Tax=Streptomyces sp. MB09-01 TaxID=3028666 RepID=UPI0029B03DE1|nr:hypothetical protein [Streptomyces sp. MB09-01]MDX3540117.1 hypothetical protein [Streptomyces sp. MB09-01]